MEYNDIMSTNLEASLQESLQDLDALKEEGVMQFPDGPSFEQIWEAGGGRRGQFYMETAHSVPGSDPVTTIAAAWCEGVIIGYRLGLRSER